MSDGAEQPRGRWLIVAALLAFAIIAVVVIAVWVIGPDKAEKDTDPETDALTMANAVQERGIAFEERVTGTGEQVAAGQFLDQYRRDQALVDCMQQRGYPDEDWTFYNTKIGWRPLTAFDSGIGWLNPLDSHLVSQDAIRLAPLQIATSTDLGHAGEPPGYVQDRRQCSQRRLGLPEGVEVDQSGLAPGAGTLQFAFIRATAKLMHQLTADHGDDYTDCMADQGYDDVTLPYEARSLLSARAPKPTDVPVADGPATAQWTTFLELEDAVLAADQACRTDIYTDGMAEAEPILDRFTDVNANDITMMAERWQAILDAAESLGFDPNQAKQTFD